MVNKGYIERAYKSLAIAGINPEEFKKELKEHIRLYLSYGFSIIPIKLVHKSLEKEEDEGKKPLLNWKEYQKRQPTQEEIERWFKTYEVFSIAIVCGEVSNFSALDIDDFKRSPIPVILDELAKKTTVVKTGRPNGIQVYSKGAYETVVLNSNPDIRIKGEGSYVIAPPSVHPSGNRYYFISELDKLSPCDLPKLVEAFRNQKTRRFEVFEVKPKLPSLPPCIQALWNEEIKEGGRNEAAFVLTSWFYQLGYPKEFIFDLLKVWNASNKPPLPENELENVVKSVDKHSYLTGCKAILNRISIIREHGSISFDCSRCEYKAYQKVEYAFVEPTREEIEYEQIPEEFRVYAPVDLFRKGQAEVVSRCYKTLQNTDEVVLNLSTGFGKTVIYLTIANKMQLPTVIICPERGLQDQLEGYGVPVLKGKRNYECSLYNISAEVAPCTVKRMECNVNCELREKTEAVENNLNEGKAVALNVGNFMKYVKMAQLLIFDEYHKILQELSKPIEVEDGEEIEYALEKRISMLEEEFELLKERIEGLSPVDKDYLRIAKKLYWLKNELQKLNFVKSNLKDALFFAKDGKKYVKLIEEGVGRQISTLNGKKLWVSATPIEFKPMKKITSKGFVATKRNAPIVYYPVGRFTMQEYWKKGAGIFRKAAEFINIIFTYYEGIYGRIRAIIHVLNIYPTAVYTARFLSPRKVKIHEKGELDKTIKEFLERDYDYLIVASAESGYDFKGKEIPLQFILNLPFPNLSDPEWKARKEKYGKNETRKAYEKRVADAIIQACGRICRGAEDIGATFILDEKFGEFYKRHEDWFDQNFKERLIWLE